MLFDIFSLAVGCLAGFVLAIIFLHLCVPFAGKLYVDKKLNQAFIGFTALDVSRLKENSSVRLSVREIDIEKWDSQRKQSL